MFQVFYFQSSVEYGGSRIGSFGSTIKYGITTYGDTSLGTTGTTTN